MFYYCTLKKMKRLEKEDAERDGGDEDGAE